MDRIHQQNLVVGLAEAGGWFVARVWRAGAFPHWAAEQVGAGVGMRHCLEIVPLLEMWVVVGVAVAVQHWSRRYSVSLKEVCNPTMVSLRRPL